MKKIFSIMSIIVSISLQAQILPVEQYNDVTGTLDEQVVGITHIKDVNGVLDKFVGTWKGSFDGKQLEIVIKKHTRDYSTYVADFHPEPLLWDQLVLKHKLTDQNGTIVYSTLDEPDNSNRIMTKKLFRNPNSYLFDYYGENFKCGDNGVVIIRTKNLNQLYFLYSHYGSTSSNCASSLDPVFPTEIAITLTKQ